MGYYSGFDKPGFSFGNQPTPGAMGQGGTPLQPNIPAGQTRGRGGTLTSLISEGGALGGAAAGAAAGSVVPVLGTAIGGIIGAGLGAFGGRIAENKVRDNRLGVGDAAKEGAISAVLAGPLRLAKYGKTAGTALKAGAGLEEALISGADDAAKFTLRGALGSKVSQGADNLVAKQFRLNPSQQFNFAKRHGEEATAVLKRFNINAPEEVLTKAIEPLQNSFDDVVTSIPAINKANLEAQLKKVYEPLIKSPVLNKQSLGQNLKTQADEILKTSGKTIDAGTVNALRKEFDQAVNYTAKGAPEYTVAKQTADGLRKLLQGEADAAGITINGAKFKDIGKDLSKLRDLYEVVGKQEYLGKGSLPIGLGATSGAVLGSAGGPVGSAAGILGTAAANSKAGRTLARNGFDKLGESLTAGAVKGQGVRGAVTGAARGQIGESLLGGATAQPFENASTTMNTANASANMPSMANMDPLSQDGGDLSSALGLGGPQGGFGQPQATQASANPYSRENLMSDLQRDPKNADKYIAYYKELDSIFNPPQKAAKTPNATQIQQANNSVSALNDIDMIRQTLSQDPSTAMKNSLPGGGLTRRFTGTSGYEAARQNVADALGRLRSGGAINADEEKRFLGLLPGPFDDQRAAAQKLARLESLFTAFANPTPAGGADTLDSAILSPQGYQGY